MANNNENKILNVPHLRFPEFTGEWSKSTIGKEFDLYSGNTPSRLDKEQFKGDINWISSGELKEHYICDTREKITEDAANSNNLRLLPIGTFVIAIYGLEAEGVRGTCSITQKLSTISQACMAFTSIGNVSNEFLYSWYKKHGNVIGLKYAQGTKQQNLSYDIISQFNISFPSKQEQDKLQRFIALLDECISTQNKIIDKLQSLISGLNDFLHLQVGGLSTSFEELGTSYSGLSGKSGDDFGKGKPYITYLNIYSNSIVNEEQVDYVVIGDNEKQNTLLYGDLLFTLSSETPDEVGIGAVYLGESDKYYLNSFCFGLHMTATNKVYSPYLAYLVSNSVFRKFIYPLAQGSTRFNLQKNDFMKKKFSLPTFENQKEIARTLNALSSKLETERKLLLNYQEQKQYLLGSMFI